MAMKQSKQKNNEVQVEEGAERRRAYVVPVLFETPMR